MFWGGNNRGDLHLRFSCKSNNRNWSLRKPSRMCGAALAILILRSFPCSKLETGLTLETVLQGALDRMSPEAL